MAQACVMTRPPRQQEPLLTPGKQQPLSPAVPDTSLITSAVRKRKGAGVCVSSSAEEGRWARRCLVRPDASRTSRRCLLPSIAAVDPAAACESPASSKLGAAAAADDDALKRQRTPQQEQQQLEQQQQQEGDAVVQVLLSPGMGQPAAVGQPPQQQQERLQQPGAWQHPLPVQAAT